MNFTNSSDTIYHNFDTINVGLMIRYGILLLLGITASVGSTLIIVTILKYPCLRKKEESSYIIGFLAVTDGATGLGTMISALNWFRLHLFQVTSFTRGECMGTGALLLAGIYSSQVMIAWIGLDRLMAVKRPLEYLKKDHFKFALRTFLITAIYSIISVCAMFTGDMSAQPIDCSVSATAHKLYLSYFGLFSFLIAIIVIVIYTLMLMKLRKATSTFATGRKSALASQLQRQARVTRSVSLILGLYCILWVTPTFLLIVSGIAGATKSFMAFFGPFVGVGSAASAASNILVYSLKMPNFRLYLKRLLKAHKDNAAFATSFQQQCNFPAGARFHSRKLPRTRRVWENIELKEISLKY